MKTGLFLLGVAALVLILVGYELYAFVTGRAHTISYLAYHYPPLRFSILTAILIFAIWWELHSAVAPPR